MIDHYSWILYMSMWLIIIARWVGQFYFKIISTCYKSDRINQEIIVFLSYIINSICPKLHLGHFCFHEQLDASQQTVEQPLICHIPMALFVWPK